MELSEIYNAGKAWRLLFLLHEHGITESEVTFVKGKTCPFTQPAFYFFLTFSVLYKQETLTTEPTVFIDPNLLSTDGTIALTSSAFSDDGAYFAYGLSESGSDWIKIKIRDVKKGEDFADCLEKVKYSSMAWTKDNKGLFYCVRYANSVFGKIIS